MKTNTILIVSIALTMITWQINAQNGGVDCSSAIIVTEGVILQTDIEDINGGHGNDAAWFVYTAIENGSINVNSCGGGEDTNLFIWNDCADSSPAAASDDACSIFPGGGIPFASEISEFVVIAGQDYFIQWDNRWSSEPFDWSISFSNTPVCQAPNSFNASNITVTSVNFTWNGVPQATNGFTLSVFEAGANPTNDTAVLTEAIAEGVTNITVTGLMASTSYDAYLNSNCSDGLISNAVTRHFSTLNVAPENDLCSEAINISCGSVTSGTTIGANPVGQGANLCNVTTGIHAPGVWYTFENTLPLGSEVTFSLCEGTSYDSQILIYSGDSCDGLTCVDSNDDACSFQSEITITTDESEQYYIYIFGFASSNGDFELSVTCGDPQEETCPAPTTFIATTILETSVEFMWNDVPQATDGFTLSVFEAGANPTNDTAVFTEDIAEGVTNITVTGLMASTSYDAYLNSNCSDGLISNAITRHFSTLNVAPENDLCSEAINISCGSVTSGTTIGANPVGQGANLCNVTTGTNAPGVWYTFENTLPLGSEVTFSLCEGTSYDSQILIYSGDSCDGLTCVDSNDDACSFQSEITITTDESEQYYIYIFGFALSEGDFELSVTCNVPQPATCEPTENAFVTNETGTTVDMAWEEVPSAIDGYITYIVLQGDDPLVDPIVLESAVFPQSTTNMTATGLEPDVAYDAYIMSICDLENNITRLSQPFTFNTNLSTSTFETESFTMSPNPADGLVTFRANVTLETLEVYSLLGQVVLNKTPNATAFSLDVSQLQTGTYFVRATANGVTTTQKLVKR